MSADVNPALEPEKRAKLVQALASGMSKAQAARAAGYTREHVSRLWAKDEQLRADVERRRGELAVVPEVATPATTEKARGALVDAVAAGALEAVERAREVLALKSSSPGVLAAQAKMAKLLLDVAGRPAPIGTVRLRREDGGKAEEVEGRGPGLEGLIAQVLGGGSRG